MLSIALSFLAKLLVSLAKTWIGEHERTIEIEKAGATAQALETESEADVKVKAAIEAGNAIKPLTVDELRLHNAATDPDFRD
jgi:hypothetical protein